MDHIVDLPPQELTRLVKNKLPIPINPTVSVDAHQLARSVEYRACTYYQEHPDRLTNPARAFRDVAILTGQAPTVVARWLGQPVPPGTYRTLAQSDAMARQVHDRLSTSDPIG